MYTNAHASSLMIIALLMFTLMGIFIRISAERLPVIEVVFFRNFLAVLIMLPLVTYSGFDTLRMQRPKLFFLRAAIGTIGMYCGFTALTLIPLAEATALNFTTPLFVTIGAVIFLGEVIRARRIAAICVGFLGTLIILQPGITDVSVGSILALVNALTIAMASLIVKLLTRTETQQAIVTWMVLLQVPIALIPSIWVWQWPDLTEWALLCHSPSAGDVHAGHAGRKKCLPRHCACCEHFRHTCGTCRTRMLHWVKRAKGGALPVQQ